MPTDEELDAWVDIQTQDVSPQELSSLNTTFSSFYSTVPPNAIFRYLYEYLKKHNVTPSVDKESWKMNFSFEEKDFGEQLPEDPDFPTRSDIKVEPVVVQAQVRAVIDPDEVVETEGTEEAAEPLYFVDLSCQAGSKFKFAEFYKQAKDECLINCHIK